MNANVPSQIEIATYRVRNLEVMAYLAETNIASAVAATGFLQKAKIKIADDSPAFLFYQHYCYLASRQIYENYALEVLIKRKRKVWKKQIAFITATYDKYSVKLATVQRMVDKKRYLFDATEEQLIHALHEQKIQPSEAHDYQVNQLQAAHLQLDYVLRELIQQLEASTKLCGDYYALLNEQFYRLFKDIDDVEHQFIQMARNTEKYDALEGQIAYLYRHAADFDAKAEMAKYFYQRAGIRIEEKAVDELEDAAAIMEAEEELAASIEEFYENVYE